MLTIIGEPVAKERPRVGKNGVYTPRRTAEYENGIAWAAKAKKLKFGDSLVKVTMRFYTASRKKTDLDNFIKSVLDGLEKGGVYKNDYQVIEIHASRHVDENPRVEVEVRKIGP